MVKVAITGSICSGKSTLLRAIERQGFCVFNCDAYIRTLYTRPNIIQQIANIVPRAFIKGILHKHLILEELQQNIYILKKIEGILYPILYKEIDTFIAMCRIKKKEMVFIEMPLLFECNMAHKFDVVAIMNTPKYKRYERFKKRADLPQLWHFANKMQWPDAKKIHHPINAKKRIFTLTFPNFLKKSTVKLFF